MDPYKKVLIIDDEVQLLNSLRLKFLREGFLNLFTAENGTDGLDIALKEHPDLILLDIIMPGMDGMEVMKKLRKDPWGKNAKIIFLTNLPSQDKELEAKSHGVNDYIIKSNTKLEDIVKLVLSYIA